LTGFKNGDINLIGVANINSSANDHLDILISVFLVVAPLTSFSAYIVRLSVLPADVNSIKFLEP